MRRSGLPKSTRQTPCRIVICGAGVIGAATAYYLARRGVRCTVVDRAGPAAAASGRAGGFLAKDWCDESPVGELARLSYELHAGLERELGVETDYRCRPCLPCAAQLHACASLCRNTQHLLQSVTALAHPGSLAGVRWQHDLISCMSSWQKS